MNKVKDIKKKKTVVKKKVKAISKADTFIPTIIKEEDNDPRHNLFEAYYTNPESPTFSNIYRSALKCGYSNTYAKNIVSLNAPWVSKIIDRMAATKMAIQARKNLEEDLSMDIYEKAIGAFGPLFETDKDGNKTQVMKRNTDVMALKQKATFFVAEKVDSLFNKSKKEEDTTGKVVFNNIFIVNPDGNTVPYNQADTEAIPGLSELIN